MSIFPKTERLCTKKLIQSLFEKGNSITFYPFKIIWISDKLEAEGSAKIVITTSKKNFNKAVERNLIKRRIRESYRENKSELSNYCLNNNLQVSFILIYIGKEIKDYKFINSKFILILNKLRLCAEKNCN